MIHFKTNYYYSISNHILHLKSIYSKDTIPLFINQIIYDTKNITQIEGSELTSLDSAGVALIDQIIDSRNIKLINFSEEHLTIFKTFTSLNIPKEIPPPHDSFLYSFGDKLYELWDKVCEMAYLTSDIFYWSIVALWNKTGHRKGSFTIQSLLIGQNAIAIVGMLSFIIGLVLALQSAIQMRNVGADHFLPNILALALVNELSPLITAVIIAGRSGSAIASEVATMKVTEELDALKMMALNPVRYVIVPKFHAITACMPLLVLFSIISGIIGGLIVAIIFLDHSPLAFINACIRVTPLKDLIVTIIKSTVFGWQIVIIGSYYGFIVQGGAEGVGLATTKAVVASIFGVIIMNAIFSLHYII